MSKPELRQRVKNKPRGQIEDDDPKWPYAHGNMDNSAKVIGFLVFVITISLVAYFRYQQHLHDIIITPLDMPKIIGENDSLPSVTPDRFWGTYRPQAYFGIKSRSKAAPVFGLMWLTQMTNIMPPPLRHWCDQGDELDGYMWRMHDGRSFGVQEIQEKTYSIKTEFVKRPGGDYGGDWSARISFVPKDLARPVVVSSFFYVALDGSNGQLEPAITKGQLRSVRGYNEEIGQFQLLFPDMKNPGERENHLITYEKQLDKLKEALQGGLKVDAWDKKRTVPYFTSAGRRVPRDAPGPNFIVKEVTAQLPMTIEVTFNSQSFKERQNNLLGEHLTSALQARVKEFDERFENVFQLQKSGYSDKEVDFAKTILSNMIGSIGYFYGSSIVQSKHNKEPVDYWESPLYTGVPSRPFFPRGFLWDEGFHNLLISMWDEEISKDIIGHWMDLMNAEGWIPREQILGVEARAKVPSEFVTQRNTNANPPTFFLPLQGLIKNMMKSNTAKDKRYLEALYPRLKTWFNYYNTSQTGKEPGTYRWHGRDPNTKKQLNPLTLASGLDDYPRASHPTDDERHVDLRCWIALAAGVMSDIARTLGKDWEEYEATHKLLTDNELLDKLHWSPKGQQYSDYGLHTDKILLVKPDAPPNLTPAQRQHMDLDKIREVQAQPELTFVNAFGYISLFPFVTKIVKPDSPKLKRVLNDIKNPNKLWTDYGLRSISRSSKFYGRYNTEHDPPYWRGSIWINLNYLTLSALHHYSSTPGPYQEDVKAVYADLRKNLVNNIMKEYHRTGYIWENYDSKNGEGKGTHPFTGWSALVVLMMAEKY